MSDNTNPPNHPFSIIDSHAHVVREFFADDQKEVIQRAFSANVIQMVNPGVVFETIEELAELADTYPGIFFALGLHPHEAKDWNEESAHKIRMAAKHPKMVGVGECGLDFFYNNSDRNSQLKAFTEQIHLARELKKPIIVHCRDAWDDAIGLLESEGKGEVRGVFHCFTGSPEHLPRIRALDFYISFSGIVTYPNAKGIQACAPLVAADRILVETDCPFLSPQKMRGKRNEPSFVWFTAEKVAELTGRSLEETAKLCVENARRLFGLPVP